MEEADACKIKELEQKLAVSKSHAYKYLLEVICVILYATGGGV